jgi:hypothetical protein
MRARLRHERLSATGLCALLLALAACGGGSSGNPASNGSGSQSGATTGSSGSAGGSSGVAGGSAGMTGAAGSTGTSGAGGSGGASGTTGAAGAAGSAGGGAGASNGGTTGTTGSGAGASGTGGSTNADASSGSGPDGSVDTGGAASTDGSDGGCTRDLLSNTINAYFTALAAHSATALPLASTVKFTENGQVSPVGTAGMWTTAGMVKYTQSALDTMQCESATEAVVPNGTMDIPYALRLRLVNQQITEIETIAVQPGGYVVSGQPFASDTAAIIASANTVNWETPVPANQQNSYSEIADWMEKYFADFPAGVCNTTSSCVRLENGGGSFNCSAGASCQAGQPDGGNAVLPYHAILADTELGIGAGFDMFMNDTDMHMFKMIGGQVSAVHAVLTGATSTGWN